MKSNLVKCPHNWAIIDILLLQIELLNLLIQFRIFILKESSEFRLFISSLITPISGLYGGNCLALQVQKLVSGDSAFRDTQKESLSHLKILLGSLCKVHGSKGHENLFKDLPVHTEMYNDVYLEDI